MTPETEPLQPDKIFDHHRQQLSAMMDGALAPDQARFLLRRLQHDTDLTACWERWQVCGDVLRGHADALLPRDFARRVAIAIATDPVPVTPVAGTTRPRWARWGGGAALAASVAVAALLVVRQAPNADAEIASGSSRAVVSVPAAAPVPERVNAPAPTTSSTAIAVSQIPRRDARRSRGQGQRAAIRNAARVGDSPAVAANAAAPTTAALATAAAADATSNDPFAIRSAATGRPWPRAILPNAPASGGFTVGLGASAAAPSFYPFEPQVPTESVSNTDADSSDAVVDDPIPH